MVRSVEPQTDLHDDDDDDDTVDSISSFYRDVAVRRGAVSFLALVPGLVLAAAAVQLDWRQRCKPPL